MKKFFFIAITTKGREYIYNRETSIRCRTKKQAQLVADFLTTNNNMSNNNFKLKQGEIWHVYETDAIYEPLYRLCSVKNKIQIRLNY